MRIETLGSASGLLARAEGFLAKEPFVNNVILSLLHQRSAHRPDARFTLVTYGGKPAGIGFATSSAHPLNLSAMSAEAARALGEAAGLWDPPLRSASGSEEALAAFAVGVEAGSGRRAEREAGLCLHVFPRGRMPADTPDIQPASIADLAVLVRWWEAFCAETGTGGGDIRRVVADRMARGEIVLRRDGQGRPAAMAAATAPAAGVTRIGYVFTPKDRRRQGHAEAVTAALTARKHKEGLRCMLFTREGDAGAAALYQKIGYRRVDRVGRITFRAGTEAPTRSPLGAVPSD